MTRPMRTALRYGALHLSVDAATVAVLFHVIGSRAASQQVAFALVFGYDAIAFGSQVALGWVQDRCSSPRTAVLIGLALTVAAVLTAQLVPARLVPAGIAAVVLAGLGNAAFHLGAGARVLAEGLRRAAPVGMFVAPGALGLGIGMWLGKHPGTTPLWTLALPPLAAITAVVVTHRAAPPTDGAITHHPAPSTDDAITRHPAPPTDGENRRSRTPWFASLRAAKAARSHTVRPAGLPAVRPLAREITVGVVVLLLVSVAVRSLVGLSASRGYPAGRWAVVGIPLAACCGKALGGILADRLGWIATTVTALLVSAPLIAFSRPHPLPLLAGLLVFQMTMPVTLVAVAQAMPRRVATAFGATCLALLLGAVPTMYSWGSAVCTKPMQLGWILVAACAVAAGLRLLGTAERRPTTPAETTARRRPTTPVATAVDRA